MVPLLGLLFVVDAHTYIYSGGHTVASPSAVLQVLSIPIPLRLSKSMVIIVTTASRRLIMTSTHSQKVDSRQEKDPSTSSTIKESHDDSERMSARCDTS